MSLRSQILEIIRTNWPNDEGTLTSETIYQQLLESSADVPEGSMMEVFDYLKRLGFIRVARSVTNSAAVRVHGNVTIIHVDRSILQP